MVYQHIQLGKRHPARRHRPTSLARRKQRNIDSVVCIAPEIDFAVLVACNRGLDIAIWKTRQAAKALIQEFGPKQTS